MDKNYEHINNDLLTRFLAGECSPLEQELLEQWKSASPENVSLLEDLKKVWSAVDKTNTLQPIDIDAEWNIHTSKYNPSVAVRKIHLLPRYVIGIAASILVLVGFSYFAWNYFSGKTITAGIAETIEKSMPDGSKISLNAGSKISYNRTFGKESRTVTLTGEGYFEITRDTLHPFVIKALGAEIKVLGTRFNVKAYKNESSIEVTVTEGKVSLYESGRENEKIILIAGEKAVFTKATHQLLSQPNTNKNYISWKTRRLVFDNDSLASIVETLKSVYHKDFIITSDNIKHCPVSTSFDNKELPVVLKVLQETIDITVVEKENKIYISGKGC